MTNTMNSSVTKGQIHCVFFDLFVYPHYSSAALVTSIATCVINVFACVGAICGNVAVLVAFWKTKELRDISNVFLMSLVCTDLLVGLVVDPMYLSRQLRSLSGRDDCGLWVAYLTVALFSTGASFLNITLIGMERCLAIFLPFHYMSIVTVRRGVIVVASVWLVWISITLLRFVGLAARAVYFICLSVIGSCYFITAFIYFNIFREARRHQKRIQTEQTILNLGDTSRQRRLARTMLFICGSLLICYTPGMVVLLFRALKGDSATLLYVAYPWAENLIFLNSAFNPAIYCWRNREIRRAVFDVLGIKRNEVRDFSLNATARSATFATTQRDDFQTSKDSNGNIPTTLQTVKTS